MISFETRYELEFEIRRFLTQKGIEVRSAEDSGYKNHPLALVAQQLVEYLDDQGLLND